MTRPWGPQQSGGVVMNRQTGGSYWPLFALALIPAGLYMFIGFVARNTGGTDDPSAQFMRYLWVITGVYAFVLGIYEARKQAPFAWGHYRSFLIVIVVTWPTAVAYFVGYLLGQLTRQFRGAFSWRLGKRRRPQGAKNLVELSQEADNPLPAVINALGSAHQQGGGVVGWWRDGSMPSGAWTEGPHLMTANPRNALLCIGPPGKGKSAAVVIPSVLLAPGMCVSTSMKREVVNATAQVRGTVGQCWLFDPTGTEGAPPGVQMVHWSPLVGITDWDSADARGLSLAESKREEASGNGKYFVNRASSVLAVLLYAAKVAGTDMVQVHRWCARINEADDQNEVEVELLTAAEQGDEGAEIAADQWHSLLSEVGTREFSSVISTLTDLLRAYTLTSVRKVSRETNFDPYAFARSSDTLYITVPKERTEQLAPVVTALIEAVRFAQYQLHREREVGVSPPGPHATFVLDEATNVAPIPMPSLVSEAGGQGLHIVVGVQSLQQCVDKWGEAARDFISMFPRKLILRGVTDYAVVEPLSSSVGEFDRVMQGYSESVSYVNDSALHDIPTRRVEQTPNWTTTRQRILTPADITNPPDGCALAFEDGNWALVGLAYFFNDPVMQAILHKTPAQHEIDRAVHSLDANPLGPNHQQPRYDG